jgi:hypothetical protein
LTETTNISVDQCRSSMHSKAELEAICKFFSDQLKLPSSIDKYIFMCALATKETNFGYFNVMRFEPAYGPNGVLFQGSQMLKESYEEFGAAVACSYGPFQIMYCVARENGYPRHLSPFRLWSGYESGPYVVRYINSIIEAGGNSIESIAAGYNGGRGVIPKPKKWPMNYVNAFKFHYDRLKQSATPKS